VHRSRAESADHGVPRDKAERRRDKYLIEHRLENRYIDRPDHFLIKEKAAYEKERGGHGHGVEGDLQGLEIADDRFDVYDVTAPYHYCQENQEIPLQGVSGQSDIIKKQQRYSGKTDHEAKDFLPVDGVSRKEHMGQEHHHEGQDVADKGAMGCGGFVLPQIEQGKLEKKYYR
jgi:hypothetical protein